jgi:hypothetical protein
VHECAYAFWKEKEEPLCVCVCARAFNQDSSLLKMCARERVCVFEWACLCLLEPRKNREKRASVCAFSMKHACVFVVNKFVCVCVFV